MKSLLTIGLIFILSPIVLKGQGTESVLWKISGKNLKQTSYLFGTYHNASYKTIDSFPKIKKVIRACEFGLFEKDENPIGNVTNVDIVIPPLDSVFTTNEYALVDSFFTNSPYGSIKPHNKEASLGAMLQIVLMLKQKETMKQEMQFDEYIHYFVRDSLKRKTFGLDETGEMSKQAAKTNYREIAKAIVYTISHDIDVNDSIPNEFFDFKLYNTSLKSDMKLNIDVKQATIKELTIERNLIWLPKIMSKINEGSCFIAVGLGHLQYKTGLIQLLRQKGYKLESVELNKSGL